MDETNYVVPPENTGGPKVSGGQQKPPKKPSAFLTWVKSNKALSAAGLLMAIIIVFVGTTVITGQKISIFGLQLNPMYQQANCPVDSMGVELIDCGTGGVGNNNNNTSQEVKKVVISGTFPESFVGQAYSTNLQTINANGFKCTYEITALTPKITGATITAVDNVVAGQENPAVFSATPTEAGTYAVKIGASCVSGTDILPLVTKDFSWVVKPPKLPPVQPTLDISGTFSDGRVGQESVFTLQTVNSDTSNCVWAIDKITPNVAGAKVKSANDPQSDRTSKATFTATPTAAGNYVVTISTQCGPADGAKTTVKKDFNWRVTGGSTSGGGGGSGGGSGGGNTAGCSANKDKLIPIYRFWKAADGDHFFTTNAGERPGDYVYEGIAGYVYKEKVAGTTEIYRSYHSGVKSHYYSTVNDATNYGYANEGILGYAFSNDASGSLPWFRLHKGYPQSDYLETTSTKEKAEVLAMGYVDQGVVANICDKN